MNDSTIRLSGALQNVCAILFRRQHIALAKHTYVDIRNVVGSFVCGFCGVVEYLFSLW